MFQAIWQYWPWLAVGLMILAGLGLLRIWGARETTPYTRRRRLVTRSELEFFQVLRQAVARDWEIFAMVRIADLLAVPRGTRNHRAWLNRILSKHIDFVLCDRDSLEVMVAIELDDASHSRPERMQRDRFVNQAFEDAGLPLLRIPVAGEYNPRQLRKSIDKAVS